MITVDRLGLSSPIGLTEEGVPVRVPVFAIWCETGLVPDLALLVASGLRCPNCHAVFPLARQGGVAEAVASTPNCNHVATLCAGCGAQIYFDGTPPDRRASLRWPVAAAQLREGA